MILTQVMAVIVTELDMKLRPLFRLTWRVADLQDVEENSSHLRLKTFFFYYKNKCGFLDTRGLHQVYNPLGWLLGNCRGLSRIFVFFNFFIQKILSLI